MIKMAENVVGLIVVHCPQLVRTSVDTTYGASAEVGGSENKRVRRTR
jgi:hypothetical protein